VRVDVSPLHVTAEPGRPVNLTVAVTNTGPLISGHEVRVLGLDPAWSEVTGGTLMGDVPVDQGILAAVEAILLPHERIGVFFVLLANFRMIGQELLQCRMIGGELLVIDQRWIALELLGDFRMGVEEAVQVG